MTNHRTGLGLAPTLLGCLAILASLILTACPYVASTLRPDALADRILLDTATATASAQALLAATIAGKAAVVRVDAVKVAASTTGYDCLHSPQSAPSIPVPLAAASAPVHLTGEAAATCYYDDQMAPLKALDDAVEAFKAGQRLSYAGVKAGTTSARAATKAAVGGIVAIFTGLADLHPHLYGASLTSLSLAVSDLCYRGSQLYVDLSCDAPLAAALRNVPQPLPGSVAAPGLSVTLTAVTATVPVPVPKPSALPPTATAIPAPARAVVAPPAPAPGR